ncbi:two-component system sensor histidine kinase ResE [Chryseomicrobium aureum]|uniref:ATP-binding protein n=1 Tax=Chryseomicrobium aureum TaxID=1441723 RepID=UPI00195809F7|nr:ATP-binding protein [Chryseomicrobium aureum]MBM7705490.1 two-component system sensor histidine kinase ResE [Chryseomicrobium aureum]
MNRIWNSVVGKLWGTIMLLVLFVLFIVTVLMLEFLEDFHTQQAENKLRQEASLITTIFNQQSSIDYPYIQEILADETNLMIFSEEKQLQDVIHEGLGQQEAEQRLQSNELFTRAFESDQATLKTMLLPSLSEPDRMENFLVLAYPLDETTSPHGVVFIYQSLKEVNNTSNQTTKIVFLSGFLAMILTTLLSFFLSTQITSPLRKMREGAHELAKGNFHTRVPSSQRDEIGELGAAFNRMGMQIKHNVEVINQDKEQLSNILSSMTDAVITFNKDASILLSNPPADELLRRWSTHATDSDSPLPAALIHMLEHTVENEEELEEEFELDSHYYSISLSLLYSKNMVRGAVAVIRDMTEQHRLDKMRSDFIANVSHELRTPIAMLQGYSEAILDDVVETEEERKEMVRIISDESNRMGRLVTELLDLARLESGYLRIYQAALPISKSVERMTSKFVQRAKERDIQVTFQSFVDESVAIYADEDRIEQVLTNLLENALRHTEPGGQVNVAVKETQSTIQIEIQDSGYGIPAEDLPYVFERFYKADKSRTRGKGGTGLGLAIAKNIIDRHEGTIWVESEVGTGTTFTIELKKM